MRTVAYSPSTPVIVTGGASGIGLACARALAEVDRPVSLWDIDGEKAEKAAREIAAEFDVTCIGLGIDVADLEAIQRAADVTRKSLTTIGGLVHAAGVDGTSPLEELEASTWDAVLNINLRSEIFILKAILPDLKNNSGSAVVGIASVNATLGNAMNPAYSASKGGMLSVTRALADDLAGSGIRINTVSPGQISTPMLQGAMDRVEGLQENFERHIMLNRLGRPEEVARAVRFLLSDEASYITATELIVDGGNLPSQR